MKPSLLIPICALLAGFAGGWLAKPAPTMLPTATVTRPPASRPAPPRPPAPGDPVDEPPPSPSGVKPPGNPTPMAARPAVGAAAESRDTAKMLRFVEAVGLSETQQADLEKILAETRKTYTNYDPAKPLSPQETLAVLTTCGAALEQSLATLLTPEQTAKFGELRQREQSNRIETKVQRELGHLSELTDLSPTQRDQILTQLRQTAAAEANAMPTATALMLDSSVLPLGPHAMPEQSVAALAQLTDTPADADPTAVHRKIIAEQRRQFEGRLDWLKPILSPAQLAQYQAAAAEQRAIHDLMIPPP